MKNFSLLILFLCLYTTTFAQWEGSKVGFDTPLNVWDMDAVDENVAWAITTDGTYSNDVWAISTSAAFATTADGGASWTVGDLPFPSSSWAGWKVSAIDANTAWVAASNPFTLGAAIYKTTDGGQTWIQQEVFSASSFCSVVHFWDADNGVTIGDPNGGSFEIYTTTDGGTTWTFIGAENAPPPADGGEFVSTSVCAVAGDNIWFGTRYSRVFRSTDRGLTWTASETPLAANTSNTWVEGIAFTDGMKGIAHTADYSSQPYQNLLVYTEDGGETWALQNTMDTDFSIFKAQYIVGTNLLLKTSRETNGAGPYKTSYSYDDGINWTDIEMGTPIADFEFTDAGTAWAGKFKNNDDATLMYKYTGDDITRIFTPQPLEVELALSPNPAIDFTNLEIKAAESMDLEMEIYNFNGQLLATQTLGEGTNFNEKIMLKDYPKGVYSLVVRNAKGAVLTKQIVKQQ